VTYDQVRDLDGKPTNIAADRMTVVLKMSDGKFLSSQGSDGSYFANSPASAARAPGKCAARRLKA